MHYTKELIGSVTEQAGSETSTGEGHDSLLKQFTVAIGTLIGISAVVQILMHWFIPGM